MPWLSWLWLNVLTSTLLCRTLPVPDNWQWHEETREVLAGQTVGWGGQQVRAKININLIRTSIYWILCIPLKVTHLIFCRYFKPLLTHSYPTLMDTLPNRCLSLGRVFTSRSVLNTRFWLVERLLWHSILTPDWCREQIMRHPMMRDPESTASATTDCDRYFDKKFSPSDLQLVQCERTTLF